MVPARNSTLLYGNGGVGKSLLAIQAGVCVATGQLFFGRMVTKGKVLFVTAEDDEPEMHRRLARVAPLEALDDFRFASLADTDAFLALPADGRRGVLEATPLYAELAEILSDERPALLVLDTLADVLGGDEIVRAQARGFVALLRRLAIQFGQANLVLAHPSLSGMATGTGTSGSTGWNNSVRSRLYFDYVRDEKRNVLDRDLRVLRTMKANYAATGQEIFMRYSDGRFLPEAMENHDPIIQRAKARLVFLRLLKKCIEQKRPVGPKPGSNYAPAIFAGDEGAERFKTKDLAKAMNELLTENKIRIDEWGPPSRRVSHLAICPGVTFDDDHGEGA